MALIRLAFVSTAVLPLTPEVAAWIEEQMEWWHRERGITGMLLYAGDTYLDVIEGEREVVHELFELMRTDKQHIWIEPLFEREIQERMFGHPTIGLCNYASAGSPGHEDFCVVHDFIEACGDLDLDAVTRGIIRLFERRAREAA